MKLSSWNFQETKAITSKTHDMLATMISLLIVYASLRRSPCMQAYKFFNLIAKDMKKSDFRTLKRQLTASVKAIPIYTLEPVCLLTGGTTSQYRSIRIILFLF